MAATEVTERHLELYDQINKQRKIRGTNLHTDFKLPAIEITTQIPINNKAILVTLKNVLKLGQKNPNGDHTVYLRLGENAAELGQLKLTAKVIHSIKTLLSSYKPVVYGVNEERGKYEFGGDELAELVFLD